MKKSESGKSPENKDHQSLGMSMERAEELLYHWINLPARYAGGRLPEYDRLVVHYPEIFPFETKQESYRVVATVRTALQLIWNSSDTRQRDWIIFVLRDLYSRSIKRESQDLT